MDYLQNVTYDHVKMNYLDRGRPLIVRGAMDEWESTRKDVDVTQVAEVSWQLCLTLPYQGWVDLARGHILVGTRTRK